MPMYTYQCDKCGVQFDRLQSFSARPLTRCPECKGHVRRRLQPVGHRVQRQRLVQHR